MRRARAAAGTDAFLAAGTRRGGRTGPVVAHRLAGARALGAGTCGRRPSDRWRGGRLLHSFARFVVEGVGTPAPAAPPERLVIGGLCRHVRNPMYLAVAATIVGQALLLGQFALIV